MLVGFSYLQQEINQLNPQTLSKSPNPNQTPTPTPLVHTTSPSPPTPSIYSGQETTNGTYNYVVYEWHLNQRYINNATWLNESMTSYFATPYNSGKTWSENYIAFISSYWEIPQQVADSDIGGLAGAAFIQNLPVNVSFNETTGLTKATYQYGEYENVPLYHTIESELPIIADNGSWTKNFG